MTRRIQRLLVAGLLGSSLLAATSCSSDSKSVSAGTVPVSSSTVAPATSVGSPAADTTPAPAPTEAVSVTAASAVATTTPPAAQAGGKVDINEASTGELEAAFKAAGVSNPRRWAQEVDEYRPYSTDPNFAKLRQELGKYNIDPAVLEKIISTLEF
jgi:hypothetical protein